MSGLLLSLPLLFAAATSADVGVSVATHARSASTVGDSADANLRVTPMLEGAVWTERNRFELNYAPQFTWRSQLKRAEPFIVHAGEGAWRGSLGSRLEGFADLHGRYGEEMQYVYILPEVADELGLFPGNQPVLMMALRADAGLEWAAAPRTDLRLWAFYDASGGVDEGGRRALPLAQGPGVAGRATHRLSPRDTIHLDADASQVDYSSGPGYRLASADVSWERRLGPHTTLTPRLGTFAVLAFWDVESTTGLRPRGALGLRHDIPLPEGRTLSLFASGDYTPALSRLDGRMEAQAGGSAGLGITWGGQLTTGVDGGFWAILPEQAGESPGEMRRFSAWTWWPLVPGHLFLRGGLGWYSHVLPGRFENASADNWDVYLGLTFRTEAVR